MLQFGASLTDNTRSVNYDCNTFTIQATGVNDKKLLWLINATIGIIPHVLTNVMPIMA